MAIIIVHLEPDANLKRHLRRLHDELIIVFDELIVEEGWKISNCSYLSQRQPVLLQVSLRSELLRVHEERVVRH